MNYKLIIFDMDGTLLADRTIYALAGALGFEGQLHEIIASDIQKYKKTKEIARILKGLSVERFLDIFDGIPLQIGAQKTIAAVKKAGMTTAIATDCYQLAADRLAKRLGINRAFANELNIKGGKITGEIKLNNQRLEPRMPGCKIHSICKRDILRNLCDELGVSLAESVVVGDGNIDRCMIEDAGMGIAFEAPAELNEVADVVVKGDLSKILEHIL
ncbi:MAG: HAD-IB family phosphatase [Methanosarcinales archaeon]|nr:MAG: HAD-IB family phosphatase [Methanosarcinales archaeon]